MSTAAIESAILSRFGANWTDTAIEWENVKFKRQRNEDYVRISLIDVSGENASLGSGHKRYRGLIYVTVFSMKAKGMRTLRTHGDNVAAIFDNQTFSGVVCSVTERRQAGTTPDGWAALTLVTPYYSDVIS